jgi:nitrate reductase gamma subunit
VLTAIYAVLFYIATATIAIGLGVKIWGYAKTPAPLSIALTPAPVTRTGAAVRVLRDAFLFASLFKANKWIWLFGYLFHAALALVLLRHMRYFIDPVWGIVVFIQPFGLYAGLAMVAGLAGLWVRRLFVPRIRYISAPSDHLMLALLLAIGVSGLVMKFVARTDIVAVKAFFRGLLLLDWQPLPSDPALLVHLALVALLMIVFPFSKLVHAPGIFFSPTRNQADTPREKRRLAPWAAERA